MPILALIASFAAVIAHRYWMRLGDHNSDWARRYWPWFLQGLLFPALIFSLFNIGWGDRLPPLLPKILEAQRAKGPWLGLWFIWSIVGLLLVTFYWSAITYFWLLCRIVERAQDRKELWMNFAFFGLLSIPAAAFLVYFSGWIYTGPAVAMALLPIVHFTTDLAEKPPTPAMYGKAIAQIKRGHAKDAEWEVISQLEKSENDFEGWMLLAELYAREYRNLEDAARVILDICRQPDVQPLQISLACDKLADWQLEIGNNPLAARAALELLCRKLPDTHFAKMAQQRIRQLPRTFEEFDDLKKPKSLRLPTLSEQNSSPRPREPISRQDAIAEANRLSDKLTDDPNDISTREKLAFVLAEKLGKIELAVEQLTLLRDLPDATEEQQAKWLAQIASWEFNRDKDPSKFQIALRALIQGHPRTSHALAAQRRLYLLEMDAAEQHVLERPTPTLRIS